MTIQSPGPPADAGASEAIRALLVDDDPGVTERAAALAEHGIEAVTANSAEGALDRLDDVDCVVAEYAVRGAEGLDLVERVRAERPGLPVVLFTDEGIAEVGREAIATGVADYLEKGEEGEGHSVLAERIEAAVAGHAGNEAEAVERWFGKLVERSADIISVLDAEGRFRYVTPSVEPIAGFTPEELIGERGLDFVHPDDREAVTEAFARALEGSDEVPSRITYRNRTKEGWQIVESKAQNLFADPLVEGLVVYTRDVTERERRRQRLEVLNRVLRHDLRNRVNLMTGLAEKLVGHPEDADGTLRTIKETGDELVELGAKAQRIERRLDRDADDREAVDLVPSIERTLERAADDHPGVEIETSLPDCAPVHGGELIGWAVDELVENAVEHNDAPEPAVRVSATCDAGTVTVRVADNGPGLPEAERAVLRRGIETPLRHSSGLGLWSVNWIAAEAGGEVEFDENDPRGTVIELRLPRSGRGPTDS